MTNKGRDLYEFGPFQLDPDKRVLLRDNLPVPLQLKAFETLLVLVRHSEQVVLKEDLMSAVWPNTFVEEGNLTQNIFMLRKTLGSADGEQRYIIAPVSLAVGTTLCSGPEAEPIIGNALPLEKIPLGPTMFGSTSGFTAEGLLYLSTM